MFWIQSKKLFQSTMSTYPRILTITYSIHSVVSVSTPSTTFKEYWCYSQQPKHKLYYLLTFIFENCY